ncbi:MAG: hypothetical protein ACKO48_01730, partial [Actinomycetota bacterium]
MKRGVLVALALAVVVATAAVFVVRTRGSDEPVIPVLIDETVSAGIDHVYDGEYPFFVGGGVATFDCNDDLKPDLYFAGGV